MKASNFEDKPSSSELRSGPLNILVGWLAHITKAIYESNILQGNTVPKVTDCDF